MCVELHLSKPQAGKSRLGCCSHEFYLLTNSREMIRPSCLWQALHLWWESLFLRRLAGLGHNAAEQNAGPNTGQNAEQHMQGAAGSSSCRDAVRRQAKFLWSCKHSRHYLAQQSNCNLSTRYTSQLEIAPILQGTGQRARRCFSFCA